MRGGIAQLGERIVRNDEVVGSIPTTSTKSSFMHSVYILQSETSGKFYVGCARDPISRLAEHQRGQTLSTRNRGPWKLVYLENFASRGEALRREKQIKSWKSHRSIRELIDAAKCSS